VATLKGHEVWVERVLCQMFDQMIADILARWEVDRGTE
jgi:hypothetical protein